MIQLVLDDIYQISALELELIRYDIPYEVVSYDKQKIRPLQPPYLMVHGVPLDLKRSLKWIKEYVANE